MIIATKNSHFTQLPECKVKFNHKVKHYEDYDKHTCFTKAVFNPYKAEKVLTEKQEYIKYLEQCAKSV